MPINYQNNINIEINGKKESSMSDENQKPSGGLQIGSLTTNAEAIIAGGDVTQDKSIHQGETNIAGDMSGDISNTNTVNNSNTIMQDVKAAFDAMIEEAGPLPTAPRDIPSNDPVPVAAADLPDPVEVSVDELIALEPVEYNDNEDHPANVYASIAQIHESETLPSEEEQKGLFSRMSSCVKKFATKENSIKAMKVAVAAISATSSLLPPLGVVKAVLETTAALNDDK